MIEFKTYIVKGLAVARKYLSALAKMFKESDNQTYDLFRFIVLAIFIVSLKIAWYEVFTLKSATFTFMDFCGGMALLITPTAALFALKKDSPIDTSGGV